MERTCLTDTPGLQQAFQQGILLNLQYWQQWLGDKTDDIAALEREWHGIITAITFGLDLGQDGWSITVKLIEEFSSYMERRGYWEVWNRVLSQAVDVARQLEKPTHEVRLLTLLARLSQRQGHFQETVAYYHRVIRRARQTDDAEQMARACSNLGFLYAESGRWQRSEVLCCRALTIFKTLDHQHGQAHTESHLGSLYTRQGRWDLAQQHFERACDLWQAMGDQHSLMRGLINLSGLYCDSKRPDDALSCLQEALRLATLTGEEIEIGTIYLNLGLTHRLKGDPVQAEQYAWQAETVFQRFDNALGRVSAWENLALACIDQGKCPEAAHHLKAALQGWREIDNKLGEVRVLAHHVAYELGRNDVQQASRQLNAVEHLISRYGLDGQAPYIRPLLDMYRHRLVSHSKAPAEALETSTGARVTSG